MYTFTKVCMMIIVYPLAGLKFWKVGSRKIFGVKQKRKRQLESANSSSSDDGQKGPPEKSPKIRPLVYTDIDKSIKNLTARVNDIFEVQSTLKVPLSMRKLFLDHFKCLICHNIMKPPIIFAKCCKRLLGCETCVEEP